MEDETGDQTSADRKRHPDRAGAVSAAAIYLMIGTEGAAAGVDPQAALAALLLSYAGQALRVIAGLFGLLLSNKKSLFTVILGVLLFVPQLAAFLQVDGSIPLILLNAVLLVIPYYYLHNAWRNYQDA